ncbi:hypothetical protein NEOLEDRAFT_1109272 [Neolentinus lepideus HHB14362 ss-1]|uniref:Rhodopsin domain-containing protein n=1 Tax=Neolentinus lepideus HHB14362 ss-1 TaxID=1314782 RepID=A0A165ULS6_9AGAM|nr:hypothetical protein NEOLEDRAFT_1109272 [Neolentinus lepideus HHB14362 ss-1]
MVVQVAAMSELVAEENQLKVMSYSLSSFAIFITILRLWERARKQRLWWDDFWALVAMLTLISLDVCLHFHFRDESHYSFSTKIALYYMLTQLFNCVNWFSKMSILFTVIRLCALGMLRRMLIRSAYLFGIALVFIIALTFGVCESKPAWKQSPQPMCNLGHTLAIAYIITDVISDTILVVAPIKLVWRLKLSRPQKIRLISVFLATFMSTAVSLYHAYTVLRLGGFVDGRAAVIQDCVSLFVANLSVIIAFIMRIATEDTPVPTAVALRSLSGISKRSQNRLDPMEVTIDISTAVETDDQQTADVIKFPTTSNEPFEPDKGRM